MAEQNQSQQFKITEAKISADRLGGFDALSYDVRTSISELNIFESLDKPYLTGTVAILDDKGLFDKISFNGTEKLRISIASVGNELDPIIEREFFLNSVEKQKKSNDNGKSSMFLFTFIDQSAFSSRLNKVRNSFNGSLDNIIIKTVARYLKKDIDISYMTTAENQRKGTVQTNIQGIIPNLTPMQAIKWLIARATTTTGSPFYCWATIHDERLRLGNLDVMLTQKPFNSKLPYSYNPSNVSTAEDEGELEKASVIKDFIVNEQGNTLELIQAGSVSSNLGNTNLNTGQITNNHFSVRKTIDNLAKEGIIVKERSAIFDPYAKVQDILMDEYDAVNYHTVTSTGTFGSRKSYHDEYNPNLLLKKIEGRSIRNHLFKNEFQAVVAGQAFFMAKASCGDMVKLNVTNDNTEIEDDDNEDTLLDKQRSGNFLIHDIRHTFQETQHTVNMNLVKLMKEL
jgi:hypothetical protein